MSVSPSLDSPPPPPPPPPPPSALAALLAESYQEVESLRRELALVRKRADKAECLASSLQALHSATSPTAATSSPPPNGTATFPESATRILMDFEDRAVRAESARDEAEARKRVLIDTWAQLESYLLAVSDAAADARAGYARIVSDGGPQLVLPQIPTLSGPHTIRNRVSTGKAGTPVYPYMTHPGSRRPRSPSMDGYHQPPNKKSRGDDQPPSFLHQPPYQEYHYSDPNAPQHTYPPPPPPPPPLRNVYRTHSQTHHPHPHHPPPQARMILPPSHNHQSQSFHRHASRSPHPHSHSRSRSSSSDTSMSVDEMLLQATTDETGTGTGPPPPAVNGINEHPHLSVVPRKGSRRNGRERDHGRPHSAMGHLPDSTHHHLHQQQQQQQQMYPPAAHPGVDSHAHPQYAHPLPQSTSRTTSSYRKVGGTASVGPESSNGNGGSGEFQTHIFAPPVTGAPTKKSKFSGQEPTVPPTHPSGQATPGVPFPPVNEHGQRICRQCGVAGRYKDGKCVEKWGPGPLGPGTVCDRCRKKMKRVERRGTMDTQHQQQQQQHQQLSTPTLHHLSNRSQSQSRAVHRTDTIPAHQFTPSTTSDNHTYSTPPPPTTTTTATTTKSMLPPASSPPLPTVAPLKEIDIPTSAIGRGSEVAAAAMKAGLTRSRSSSRNSTRGVKGSKGRKMTPPAAAAAAEVNGHVHGDGAAPAVVLKKSQLGNVKSGSGGSRRVSKSPLGMDVDGEVEVEVDAEADVDVDVDAEAEVEVEVEAEAEVEAEIKAELEGVVDGVVAKRLVGMVMMTAGDAPMEVEADLLEAVDAAAEAKSAQVEDE